MLPAVATVAAVGAPPVAAQPAAALPLALLGKSAPFGGDKMTGPSAAQVKEVLARNLSGTPTPALHFVCEGERPQPCKPTFCSTRVHLCCNCACFFSHLHYLHTNTRHGGAAEGYSGQGCDRKYGREDAGRVGTWRNRSRRGPSAVVKRCGRPSPPLGASSKCHCTHELGRRDTAITAYSDA